MCSSPLRALITYWLTNTHHRLERISKYLTTLELLLSDYGRNGRNTHTSLTTRDYTHTYIRMHMLSTEVT